MQDNEANTSFILHTDLINANGAALQGGAVLLFSERVFYKFLRLPFVFDKKITKI